MSVAPLTADEFGTFAAIAHKLGHGTMADLCAMAETMATSNAAAYAAQYGETFEPATAGDIEAVALRKLADDDLSGHWGPLVYNCVTNDGTLYYGALPAGQVCESGAESRLSVAADIALWRKIEGACRTWADQQAADMARREADAEAFDEVGRLPMKSPEQLRALMGDGALIVAEFRVDETDTQADYFGGRSSRRVVIGVRKGKRESFAALRKSAAKFKPTAEYGPGRDIYTVRVVFANDVTWNGSAYWKGSYSHWHSDIGHGNQFATRAEAEAFVATAGTPEPIRFDDQVGHFAWDIGEESYEHRENWSMGGGNYLGRSRYGGWVVKSTQYINSPMESFI